MHMFQLDLIEHNSRIMQCNRDGNMISMNHSISSSSPIAKPCFQCSCICNISYNVSLTCLSRLSTFMNCIYQAFSLRNLRYNNKTTTTQQTGTEQKQAAYFHNHVPLNVPKLSIIFLSFVDWLLLAILAASSTAVLVELTPLLGALLGVVVTLVLVAVCIVIFVKVRGKVSVNSKFSDR